MAMADEPAPAIQLRGATPQAAARRLGGRAVLRRLAGGVPGRAVQSAVHQQAEPDRRKLRRPARRAASCLRELAVSAVPFVYGFTAAVVVGVSLGVVMGWRVRVGYALDPLMTVFYASPLVALAPLVIVFFGVGVSGKAIIIFLLSVFPFIFNAYAGVRAVDRLLINVVRSLGGTEKDLYLKVIVPSVLPYHRRRRAHRRRPRADRRPGRRVLRRLGRHRLRDRPVRRSVRARQDVRLHPHHHGHRGRAHRGHPLGRARGVPVAHRAIGDERIARHSTPRSQRPRRRSQRAGEERMAALRADHPRRRQHRRAAARVGARAAPRHAVGRHQAVLHHAEPDRRHALDHVRDRHDLGAARRQRLRLRARPRSGDRGRAAARRADRALAHAQRDVRSVHHRVQRDAAAGVPAAGRCCGSGSGCGRRW